MKKVMNHSCSVIALAMVAAFATPSMAQDEAPAAGAEAGGGLDDIVVTARRRDETSIAVPVTLTAVNVAELGRRGINTIDGIAKLVPSLVTGDAGGTLQGGIVTIRGISGAETNTFADQAVSFNVDGVQVARAAIRRAATMDLEQVEVLKGPQALFFGKNSPAGIISIRTADPTPDFRAGINVGYEFNAHEIRADGFVSGPLTDQLGFRLAGYFSDMRGWIKNLTADLPAGGGVLPNADNYTPNSREFSIRGTLKWEPSDSFNARLKLTYNNVRGDSINNNAQIYFCQLGTPQMTAPLEDCKADDKTTVGGLGPNFNTISPLFPADGKGYYKQDQFLGGLEWNYNITDQFTLSSVTGFYHYSAPIVGSFSYNYIETGRPNTGVVPGPGALPTGRIFAAYNKPTIRDLTQEVRLASNLDGPFNFLTGAHFQDSRATIHGFNLLNATTPGPIYNYSMVQEGTAYSFFAQGTVDFTDTVQLSVGGRYSHEKKKLAQILQAKAATIATLEPYVDPTLDRDVSFNNFSPEFALRWRPTQDLTVYGSYKKGFLSGGFNANNPSPGVRANYDQQLTRGYEMGVKASLLDGALRTNLAFYNYRTSGLQVNVTVNGAVAELRNAGSIRTKGIEFDYTYKTPIEGLRLNGAINYNDAKYIDYQAACYRGQPSETCFLQVSRVTGNLALLQELSGQRLGRAPKWTGNAGFDYETPVTSGLKLGLSSGVTYSSGYFPNLANVPASWQKSYALLDASIRVSDADDRWQVALIGQNLTEEFVNARVSDVPFTGSAPGSRTAADPLRLLGDLVSNPGRGRQIMLQVGYKFGQ